MSVPRPQRPTHRRVLLLGVAALLTGSALLAVAILLIGRFGDVEGRILATTAMLGGFGILALPSAMLLDQDRSRRLAGALLAACAAAAALSVSLVWHEDAPGWLGRTTATVVVVAIAGAQTAALVARRGPLEPPLVDRLFAASVLLAVVVTTLIASMIWSGAGEGRTARVLGALVVLDLLTAALQPILARARAAGVRVRLRMTVAPGSPGGAGSGEVSADGRDAAAAVAAAIRRAEREGGRVDVVEILERAVAPPG